MQGSRSLEIFKQLVEFTLKYPCRDRGHLKYSSSGRVHFEIYMQWSSSFWNIHAVVEVTLKYPCSGRGHFEISKQWLSSLWNIYAVVEFTLKYPRSGRSFIFTLTLKMSKPSQSPHHTSHTLNAQMTKQILRAFYSHIHLTTLYNQPFSSLDTLLLVTIYWNMICGYGADAQSLQPWNKG